MLQKTLLRIAETTIRLEAEPFLIPPSLMDFTAFPGEEPELEWQIRMDAPSPLPDTPPLLKAGHTVVHSGGGQRLFISFPPYPLIARLEVDAGRAVLYLSATKMLSSCPRQMMDNIHYALEVAFFCAIQHKQRIAVHSASLLYRDAAYLFIAPSGTGKSTHVGLWREALPEDVSVLDGDVAVCGLHEGVPCAWGLPWAGTSGEYQNRRARLGGLIFLQQAPENKAQRLPMLDGTIRLISRCFTPTWTKEMAGINFSVSEKLAAQVPCYLLGCRPDQGAVTAIRRLIDEDA